MAGRPSLAQIMRRAARDVGRNAHAYRSVAAQINEPERLVRPDPRTCPGFQLGILDRPIAQPAIPIVAQDRFEKADLQRASEINDAKPRRGGWIGSKISEAARSRSESQRVGESALIEPQP